MSKTNLFDQALTAEGVTGKLGDLARSIYTQESGGGKNTKTSNAGARGGMQILPGTFAQVADKDWSIDDPLQNARAGIRYLKQLDKLSGGVPELTAAGYYGGPGGMAKAKQGIAVSDPRNPNAPNTLQYGQQVVARLGGKAAPTVPAAPPVQLAQAPLQALPVDLPPDLPPQMAVAPEAQPVPLNQSDAWQEFLRTVPGARQPVNVADIDYANPQVATQVPQFQYQQAANLRPNFDAFGAWGRKAA